MDRGCVMSSEATISVVGGWAINQLSPGPNNAAGESSARASNILANISLEQWENYKKNFMPLEAELIAEAKKAGSQEEIAAAEGRAGADVTGAFSRANKSATDRMRAYGINPASQAFGSAATTSGLAEGAAMAGARTGARNQQKNLAYSRLQDAVALGKGIAPSATAAASASAAAS